MISLSAASASVSHSGVITDARRSGSSTSDARRSARSSMSQSTSLRMPATSLLSSATTASRSVRRVSSFSLAASSFFARASKSVLSWSNLRSILSMRALTASLTALHIAFASTTLARTTLRNSSGACGFFSRPSSFCCTLVSSMSWLTALISTSLIRFSNPASARSPFSFCSSSSFLTARSCSTAVLIFAWWDRSSPAWTRTWPRVSSRKVASSPLCWAM
mmetsp:Transcript_29504/g.74907  ORF Transcript_29504/g.74907 Transcript_29504/m.74907 type:complete len:220 (+) Transcript_29504:955-1614(+)